MQSKVRSESENSKQKDGDLQNAIEAINNNQTGQTRSDEDAAGAAHRLSQLRIDLSEILPPPPLALVQTVSDDDHRQIFSLGNISVITGKAKTRKTFALGIIAAAALGAENIPGRLKGTLPEGKRKVLYFDTEQSKYDAQLTAKRINAICGDTGEMDNFIMYGMAAIKQAERKELIEYAIKNTPGVGFVIIDGVRDIIPSINNEEQATDLIDDLRVWATTLGIHITSVLHKNKGKGDTEVRGWLGSEMINKAETVIALNREPNDPSISTAAPEQTRKRPFEEFSFEIDNTQRYGIPVEAADVKARTTKPKEMGAEDMTYEAMETLVANIFKRESELTATDLLTRIGVEMRKCYNIKKFGINKQNALKAELEDNFLIIYRKTGARKYYSRNVATSEDLL